MGDVKGELRERRSGEEGEGEWRGLGWNNGRERVLPWRRCERVWEFEREEVMLAAFAVARRSGLGISKLRYKLRAKIFLFLKTFIFSK